MIASAVMCFPSEAANAVPAARPRVAVPGQRELLAHDGANRVALGSWGELREVSAALHSDQTPGGETFFRGVIVRLAAGIEDQHLAPQPCTFLPFLTRRTRKLTDIFAWVSLA